MNEKFTGSTQALKNAKKRGLSDKAKKYIAASLMAGNLMVAGTPGLAAQYTPEELTTHERYVEEIEKANQNIYTQSSKSIDELYKTGKITQEQYNIGKQNLEKLAHKGQLHADTIRSRTNNINDKNLIFMRTLQPQKGDNKTRIELNLNDISSLNQKQIETLEQKYNIDSIVLNRYYEMNKGDGADEQFTYSAETYKKMLKTMNEKFGDLKNNKNLSETEKTTIVLKRIQDIQYDYDSLQLPANDMSNSKFHTSRSMEDPLLNQTGICTGYSDLFKNTMSYLGIESKELRGHANIQNDNTLPGQANHGWNQVKLDGQWYNLDITEISQNKDILTPGADHQTLFTSDSQFNTDRSEKAPKNYTPIYGLPEEAKSSMPPEKIDLALQKAEKYEEKRLEPSFFKRTRSKLTSLSKTLFNTQNKTVNHEEPAIQTSASNTSKANSKRSAFLSKLSGNGEYQKVADNYLKTHQQEYIDKEHSKQNTQQQKKPYDDNERV